MEILNSFTHTDIASLAPVNEILSKIISCSPVDNLSTFYYTWAVSLTLLSISNYMMILISLNRYALVCKPFSHHKITSRRSTLKQIIAMSTILTLLGLLNIFDIGDLHGVCKAFLITVVFDVFLSHTVSVVLTILVIYEFRKNRSTFNECMNTRPLMWHLFC